SALKETENFICRRYNYIEEFLPEDISFITSQELEDLYPNSTSKEREYNISKLKGAVFISQIGKTLASGQKHDGRAPDYDDWELNGDIIVYYPVIDIALELSSMGIRVDEEALMRQLELADCTERAELTFQKALLNGELPYTVGGGIGQSRICMFYLRKAHIGEVQSSVWPEEIVAAALKNGIQM
ncbi:MAG: aspartate--ammonia ligase, partial [Lachnospiraceae bacterium]